MKLKHVYLGIVSMLVACVVSTSAQPPVINDYIVDRDVAVYQKQEIRIDVDATFDNPFNYDEVSLQAVIETPSGDVYLVDGFYSEQLEINTSNGSVNTIGQPQFFIRYTPLESGKYYFQLKLVDLVGETETALDSFMATPSSGVSNHGYGRTENDNGYFYFDDGSQYIPIGENICWQNSNPYLDYKLWLDNLKQAGGNFFRLWHAHWGLGIEWASGWNNHPGLGRYNQVNSAYLDWMLDYCGDNGIYIMLALQHHGQVSTNVNPNWSENPYNIANGGPCQNTWDFFTNQDARKLTKNRLRYIVARWGYSQNVMSWELFNEVDWTDEFELRSDDVADWHLEMSAFIKDLDVNSHLVTTSFARDIGPDRLWSDSLIDFVQLHHYGNSPFIHRAVSGRAGNLIRKYNKPVVNGEFGLGSSAVTNAEDPDGIHLHNTMWSSLMGGCAGPGMTWWWDSYVEPRDLYHYFTPLVNFTENVGFYAEDLSPATSDVVGVPGDLEIVPFLDWGEIGDTLIEITMGQTNPEMPALSKFLYGSEWNTQFKAPPVFDVSHDEAWQLTLYTGDATGQSPVIVVYLDGHEVLNQVAVINSSYSVDIPPGEHHVKIDNDGTDWISISNYKFSGLGNRVESVHLKSADSKYGAGWMLNNDYNHVYLQQAGIPDPVQEATLVMQGLHDGDYSITWIDPLTGESFLQSEANADHQMLEITVPEFTWDIAYIYQLKSNSSVSEIAEEPFRVYPNPIRTGDPVFIDKEGHSVNCEISIFDSMGRRVTGLKLKRNTFNFPSEVLPGVYWLSIIDGKSGSSVPIEVVE